MPTEGIVTGQKVDKEKWELARSFRRHMTAAEGVLWNHLRAGRLQGWHFRRQQIIDGFVVDFYCHAVGLIVEVDGPVHERRADYDESRSQVFADRGLRVLRFTNDEVVDALPIVLEHISEACRQRASALPPA
jgi:very-short-patch-repair endonuclease